MKVLPVPRFSTRGVAFGDYMDGDADVGLAAGHGGAGEFGGEEGAVAEEVG